eukprot:6193305-Pleurochrysis_carterae.AAC.4
MTRQASARGCSNYGRLLDHQCPPAAHAQVFPKSPDEQPSLFISYITYVAGQRAGRSASRQERMLYYSSTSYCSAHDRH